MRLLTDITEFALADGKLHLSPVIDCCNGKTPAHTTGRHPDARLADTMLEQLGTVPRGRRADHPFRPGPPPPVAGMDTAHEAMQVEALHEPQESLSR